MTDQLKNRENDSGHHTDKLRILIDEAARQARADISELTDPKIKAFFETVAEILSRLSKEIENVQQKAEQAGR